MTDNISSYIFIKMGRVCFFELGMIEKSIEFSKIYE